MFFQKDVLQPKKPGEGTDNRNARLPDSPRPCREHHVVECKTSCRAFVPPAQRDDLTKSSLLWPAVPSPAASRPVQVTQLSPARRWPPPPLGRPTSITLVFWFQHASIPGPCWRNRPSAACKYTLMPRKKMRIADVFSFRQLPQRRGVGTKQEVFAHGATPGGPGQAWLSCRQPTAIHTGRASQPKIDRSSVARKSRPRSTRLLRMASSLNQPLPRGQFPPQVAFLASMQPRRAKLPYAARSMGPA